MKRANGLIVLGAWLVAALASGCGADSASSPTASTLSRPTKADGERRAEKRVTPVPEDANELKAETPDLQAAPTEAESPRWASLPKERADSWIPPTVPVPPQANTAEPEASLPNEPPVPTPVAIPGSGADAASDAGTEPGTAEPGSAEPGTAEPGAAEPGAAEPGPRVLSPMGRGEERVPREPRINSGTPLTGQNFGAAEAGDSESNRETTPAPASPLSGLPRPEGFRPPFPPRIPSGSVPVPPAPVTGSGNPLRKSEPRIPPAPRINPLRLGAASLTPTPPTRSAASDPAGGAPRPAVPPSAADYGPPPTTTPSPPIPPFPTRAGTPARAPAEFTPDPVATTPLPEAEEAPAPGRAYDPGDAAPAPGVANDSVEAGPTAPAPESAPAETPLPESAAPEATSPESAMPGPAAPESAAPESAGPDSLGPAATAEPPVTSSSDDGDRQVQGLLGSGDGEASAAKSATPGDDEPFTLVKVYYGTDRLPVAAGPLTLVGRLTRPASLLALGLFLTALIVALLSYRASRPVWSLGAGAVAGVVLLVVIVQAFRGESAGGTTSAGVAYGNGRGELQYGECAVTIPKRHVVGQVERPSVWRLEVEERSDKHIILKSVEPRDEQAFFTSIRERVAASPRKDLFVFIHGYNVTFDMAARRTAQMAHDLNFEGAPIFYSWPSQGGLLQYPIDETNVAWTVPHLKKFLRDIAQRSDAQAINLIAHSMGNRALAAAIQELTLEDHSARRNFHQIVLAAPDVDAEVFKRDIAPVLTRNANQVTLYASSRDQALVASKLVHGYPRAGDSGSNLVVIPGVETVDVTEVDTGILGHSYYGNSVPILQDLNQLLRASANASRRPWLTPAQRDGQAYWVFDERATAAREAGARR